MKKQIFLIHGLLLIVGISFAQINVSHVTSELDVSSKQGVFYALPATLIQVNLKVTKTEYIAGPYAQYASKYLDLENVITDDYNNYEIVEARLNTSAVPDPDHIYFAELNPKTTKENVSVLLSLSEAGLAMGVDGTVPGGVETSLTSSGFHVKSGDTDYFRYFAETNLVEQTDTIIQKVVVDTVVMEKFYLDKRWVEKSDEQKAVEAANKINKIRDARFNLLSGYQEVPFDAGAISFMYDKLVKLEDEFLSLFAGISIKKQLHYTFTVKPDKEENSILTPVFVFSSTSGIKSVGSTGGEKINLRIEKLTDLTNLNAVVNKRNDGNSGNHGFYYRIPSSAIVTLEINNDIKPQRTFPISQLGETTYLPTHVTSVQFHKNTGAIKAILIN